MSKRIRKNKIFTLVYKGVAVVVLSTLTVLIMDAQKVSAATTNLSSDFAANSLTVNAADFYYTNGYEVDIGNQGLQIYGIFDALDDVETDETFINSAQEFDVYLGASFIPDQSTVTLDDSSGSNTVVTAGTAPVYNLIVNTGGDYTLQDPIEVQGALTITTGTLDVGTNYQMDVAGDWTNDGTFLSQNGTVILGGTGPVNLDSGCATASSCDSQDFYNLTINKTSATDNVILTSTHLNMDNLLTITDGELVQGTLDVQAEGSDAVFINNTGTWTNISTGNLALQGTFENHGVATFQGNGSACPQADSITISSVGGSVVRVWEGSGAYNINDVSVSYMGGDRRINAFSSTDGGNNLSNWFFLGCTVQEGTIFEDLIIDGGIIVN